ncbi:hypothetical protein FJY63_10365 [Candidatus Sumerlaeota bacterium]|nr:hypothetical protein [Candidatus Sumerlaeota bacterium]
MKLTEKDAEFLTRLRELLDEKGLSIEFRTDGIKRFVLKKNYGLTIERRFGMTRQGVRWRFQRLFGEIYPSTYETLLFIESNFGTGLRSQAMEIARQRAEARQEALKQRGLLSSKRTTNDGQHENRNQP